MEKSLRRYRDWIEGEPYRVIEFRPFAKVENGKVTASPKGVPYAFVTLECRHYPTRVTGYISHAVDFSHLWAAFVERGINSDEEVVIFPIKKYLNRFAKLFAAFMPGLWVTVCKADAYRLMTERDFKPELHGRARFLAERPIASWKPGVMIE